MKLNVYGYDIEVYHHPDGFWGDDRIIFQQEPDEDMRKRILHYLYNEAFIKDRRTICQII